MPDSTGSTLRMGPWDISESQTLLAHHHFLAPGDGRDVAGMFPFMVT